MVSIPGLSNNTEGQQPCCALTSFGGALVSLCNKRTIVGAFLRHVSVQLWGGVGWGGGGGNGGAEHTIS